MLFPIVALLGASGIIVGILNSYDEFSIPALAPVAWNLAIILGLVLGVPQAHTADGKLYVYAGSIVVGTVIQVLLPVPWLRGRGGRLELVIDWRDPAVRQVLKLMLPVALGLGLINFNALVDGVIAANRINADLGPAAIDAAFRIYMLPQGVFSVAVATVLFPSLARFASRGDMTGFRSTVSLGVRQIVFLLVPSSIVVAVLAEPLTRLIYQRGAFTANQTPVVAASLAAFALGLTFNGTMLMLNRAFFSLQSNWIPTIVALGNLFVNLVLDLAVRTARHLGHPARDVARQHRRHRDAARPAPAPRRPDPLRRDRRLVVADRARRARCGRRGVRRLVRDRRRARPRRPRADRLARRRHRGGDGRVRRRCASCCTCASWTRSARSPARFRRR